MDSLNKDIEKLERIIQKGDAAFENLMREKQALEKEVAELQRELDTKPTGLGAITSNPEFGMKMLDIFGPVLADLGHHVKNVAIAKAGGTPVGGGSTAPAPAEEHPLLQWLGSQPLEVQTVFINLMNRLGTFKPERLKHVLTQMLHTTSAMRSA